MILRPNFDYIRLFLSIIVMLEHYGLRIFASIPYLSWFSGDEAVLCFFIISGYFITYSYTYSKNVGEYFFKRLKRLYPPIIALSGIAIIMGLINGAGANWYRSVFNFMTFYEVSVPEEYSYFTLFDNPPFWSLVIEFHFYLVIPIILFFRRSQNFKFILLGLSLLSIALRLLLEEQALQNMEFRSFTRQSLLFYFDFFCIGIALFIYQGDKIKEIIANGKRAVWGDLSYGIYIYHWVVMDVMRHFGS